MLKLIAVAHLYYLDFLGKDCFHIRKLLVVSFVEYLIRICGINVITCSFGECEISRIREITRPCKVIYLIRILTRNVLGLIDRAGIDNDNLIHKILDTVKASCKDVLFIFDYHYAGYRHNICPPGRRSKKPFM
jgi:hypothetical protein